MTESLDHGRASGRSPIAAAVLSAVIPGAGQWYAGHRGRAAIFAAPFVAGLIVVVVGETTVSVGFTEVLGWIVRPSVLRLSLGLNVAAAAWRIIAVLDAYFVAGGRRPSVAVTSVVLVGVGVLVAAPHVVAASYALRGITLLETVFVADAPPSTIVAPREVRRDPLIPDAPPVWFDPLGFESVRSARNLVFRKGTGDPEAIDAWVEIIAPPSPDAPFLPFEERVGADRLTILLVGADEGPGREGLRTDSMIIATVDVETGDAALFGLPRNFKRVPLPRQFQNSFIELEKKAIENEAVDEDGDGYPDDWVDEDGDGIPDRPAFVSCHCFPEMLNRVHQYTLDWTRTYPDTPDPGLAALKDVISNLVDLPIDYYFMVNMAGFVDVVDVLGGVDVMVKEPFHVMVSAPSEDSPKAKVNVEPGMNHLTGLEALAYSRWRIGSSDYARMVRQRCLIRAAVDEVDPFTLVRSFRTMADVVERSVVTDIPLSFLPDMVDILGRVDLDRIATVGFVPPTYNDGRAPGGYPIPNVSRIRWKVGQVLEGGAVEQSTTGESECGM